MSMIGKTLGNFEITTLLGRGGMGVVYQAKDQKLGRDVAIKVLPEEFAKDTDRVARFQREAKLLASLNHPNIASIYGLKESEGTQFLILEPRVKSMFILMMKRLIGVPKSSEMCWTISVVNLWWIQVFGREVFSNAVIQQETQ